MRSLWYELRHAARSLARTPAFSVPAVLTLALGIATTATIFSVAYAVLLRPLPYPDPNRLFVLSCADGRCASTGELFHYLRDRLKSFENVAANGGASGWNLVTRGRAEHVTGLVVSRGYFDVIGIRPMIGRGFTAAEDQAGGPAAVIVSEALWRRAFDASPQIVGQPLQLGGTTCTIVGVMPASFWNVPAVDVWTPLRVSPRSNDQNYTVIARLRSDATQAQAAGEFDALRSRLPQEVRSVRAERAASLAWVSYQDWLGSATREQLIALNAAVALLLLIACVNVASLQLVRGVARRREMATRAALGGDRRWLLRIALVETLLVALTGSALGLVAAGAGIEAFVSAVPASMLGNYVVSMDWTVAGITVVLTVASAVVFGLAPALNASRFDVRAALWDGGRHTGARQTVRLRQLFVAAQIALAVVLLVGAGLFIRSFVKLRGAELGFDPAHLVVADMALQGSKNQIPGDLTAFFERTLAEMRAIPGVAAAAIGSSIPVERGLNLAIRPPEGGAIDQVRSVDWQYVTPDYFALLRIPLRSGRMFDSRDRNSSAPVAIVNEAFARTIFDKANVIGELIPMTGGRLVEVVGVVGDVKSRSGAGWTRGLNALGAPAPPKMYVPVAQVSDSDVAAASRFFPMRWIARTTHIDLAVEPAMREIVRRAAPNLPFQKFQTMNDIIARDVEEQRFLMQLFVVFACCAVLLAGVGIYGLTAYAVGQREQEVGIRIALGATPEGVLRRFMVEGAAVVSAGLAAGIIMAIVASRFIAALVFGVTPSDPLTFTSVALLLMGVAATATLIPSLHAAKVNPVRAMRAE